MLRRYKYLRVARQLQRQWHGNLSPSSGPLPGHSGSAWEGFRRQAALEGRGGCLGERFVASMAAAVFPRAVLFSSQRSSPPCLLPFCHAVISPLKRLHVYCIYAVLPYEDCMNMCFSNGTSCSPPVPPPKKDPPRPFFLLAKAFVMFPPPPTPKKLISTFQRFVLHSAVSPCRCTTGSAHIFRV